MTQVHSARLLSLLPRCRCGRYKLGSSRTFTKSAAQAENSAASELEEQKKEEEESECGNMEEWVSDVSPPPQHLKMLKLRETLFPLAERFSDIKGPVRPNQVSFTCMHRHQEKSRPCSDTFVMCVDFTVTN